MTEELLITAPADPCPLPGSAQEMLACEKKLSARIDRLTILDRPAAETLCTALVRAEEDWPAHSPASSAACARCVTRFLLHKKCKCTLVETIRQNAALRTAIFGRLNAYQYSLIFLLKRLVRLNDHAMTQELLELLAANPYRDDTAKSYESRWSLAFLMDEVLKAPADYLRLDASSLALLTAPQNGEGDGAEQYYGVTKKEELSVERETVSSRFHGKDGHCND